MTSKRKTPCTNWFPGSVKPVRVGVYKRLWRGYGGTFDAVFSYWNGRFWGQSHETDIQMVVYERNNKSYAQNLAWCGLANDPEKVAR